MIDKKAITATVIGGLLLVIIPGGISLYTQAQAAEVAKDIVEERAVEIARHAALAAIKEHDNAGMHREASAAVAELKITQTAIKGDLQRAQDNREYIREKVDSVDSKLDRILERL